MPDEEKEDDCVLHTLTKLAESCRAAPRFGKNGRELVLAALSCIDDDYEFEPPPPAPSPSRTVTAPHVEVKQTPSVSKPPLSGAAHRRSPWRFDFCRRRQGAVRVHSAGRASLHTVQDWPKGSEDRKADGGESALGEVPLSAASEEATRRKERVDPGKQTRIRRSLNAGA